MIAPAASTTHTVTGMVCGHCATLVTEEISRIAGVTAVAVDVAGQTVTVTSDRRLDPRDMRNAVEEAGYELTAFHAVPHGADEATAPTISPGRAEIA
ncbi:heavy-metal-associated domain-containing protein [Streptomyces xantholiticus]